MLHFKSIFDWSVKNLTFIVDSVKHISFAAIPVHANLAELALYRNKNTN